MRHLLVGKVSSIPTYTDPLQQQDFFARREIVHLTTLCNQNFDRLVHRGGRQADTIKYLILLYCLFYLCTTVECFSIMKPVCHSAREKSTTTVLDFHCLWHKFSVWWHPTKDSCHKPASWLGPTETAPTLPYAFVKYLDGVYACLPVFSLPGWHKLSSSKLSLASN